MYEVYTLPACEKCQKAIDGFRKRRIEFEEINASSSDGIKKLREFIKPYRDRIKREEGALVFPIIVYQEDTTIRIYQGEEGLAQILNENENS